MKCVLLIVHTNFLFLLLLPPYLYLFNFYLLYDYSFYSLLPTLFIQNVNKINSSILHAKITETNNTNIYAWKRYLNIQLYCHCKGEGIKVVNIMNKSRFYFFNCATMRLNCATMRLNCALKNWWMLSCK